MLCKAGVETRACLYRDGPVGWGFWDVKEGFQNVLSSVVFDVVLGCEPFRMWMGWLRYFLTPREFEVSWDSKVRGMGWAEKGVP